MAAQKDLLEFIDFPNLECLNEKPSNTVQNVLKQGYRDQDDLTLESDTDAELIINVQFNQKVKINAIGIKAKQDDECAPKTIKLYTNRAHMGFSDTSSVPCAQELTLTPAQLNGEPIPLKFVKFQNVTLLSIFIENNQGDEEVTRLSKITLHGSGGEVFNVAEIKKQEEH